MCPKTVKPCAKAAAVLPQAAPAIFQAGWVRVSYPSFAISRGKAFITVETPRLRSIQQSVSKVSEMGKTCHCRNWSACFNFFGFSGWKSYRLAAVVSGNDQSVTCCGWSRQWFWPQKRCRFSMKTKKKPVVSFVLKNIFNIHWLYIVVISILIENGQKMGCFQF